MKLSETKQRAISADMGQLFTMPDFCPDASGRSVWHPGSPAYFAQTCRHHGRPRKMDECSGHPLQSNHGCVLRMGVPNKWWFFVEPKKIQKGHKTKNTTHNHPRAWCLCLRLWRRPSHTHTHPPVKALCGQSSKFRSPSCRSPEKRVRQEIQQEISLFFKLQDGCEPWQFTWF